MMHTIREYQLEQDKKQAGLKRIEYAMRYVIVVEPTGTGCSPCSPDLPGWVATGRIRDDVEREMRKVIELYIDGMRKEGYDVPSPRAYSTYVEVPA